MKCRGSQKYLEEEPLNKTHMIPHTIHQIKSDESRDQNTLGFPMLVASTGQLHEEIDKAIKIVLCATHSPLAHCRC
jgi:NCAIR mutase (PurE)-related protein